MAADEEEENKKEENEEEEMKKISQPTPVHRIDRHHCLLFWSFISRKRTTTLVPKVVVFNGDFVRDDTDLLFLSGFPVWAKL